MTTDIYTWGINIIIYILIFSAVIGFISAIIVGITIKLFEDE